MNYANKLTVIKIIHTLVWIFFNVVIIYLIYSALTGKIDRFTWMGIIVILVEGLVLLIFRKMCPLTLVARKYSDSQKSNFDIYLPEWLAKYNKLIYSSIFVAALVVILFRSLS